MNADIRDVHAIRALLPLEVVAYLRSHDWTQQTGGAPKSSVWTRVVDDDEYEAAVPLDRSIGDYALRMGELLHTVAHAERRPQSQVYADLLTTFADVVRIRVDDPELQDGTLPIEAHAQIAVKVRDLLLAAACSARERRPVWHTRKPSEAVEYARKVRIGQSERGSYVLTVISRVSPALQEAVNGSPFDANEPFERRMIQSLAWSLHYLDEAAQQAAISGTFAIDKSIENGVSANLCEAVTGLWGDGDGQRNLEFAFTWSPARPIEAAIPSLVKFTPDRIPVIREAARIMRDREPVFDYELEGAVVRLDRVQGSPTGRVTVMGQVDGSSKRVTLELGDPHYHLAIQAHEEERALRCVGSLVREGRAYVLRDPREVTLEDE